MNIGERILEINERLYLRLRAQGRVDKFPEMIAEAIGAASQPLVASLNQRASEMLREHAELRTGFEQRLAQRWRRPLDLYEMVMVAAEEAGAEYYVEHQAAAAEEDDLVFEALVALRVGARLRLGRACLAGPVVGSAAGGSVRDQPGDRQMGLAVVLAPSDPALQGPPLLVFGIGVLDADPPGGLLAARLLIGGHLVDRRVLGRLGRWGVDLVAERLGKPLIASIDRDADGGMLAQ